VENFIDCHHFLAKLIFCCNLGLFRLKMKDMVYLPFHFKYFIDNFKKIEDNFFPLFFFSKWLINNFDYLNFK